jgi:hypothetical protein
MSPSDLTQLALVVANTVGALHEPVEALAVLAAMVTLLLVLSGLASERHELSNLTARGQLPQVRPARPRARWRAHLGPSRA